MDAETRAAYWRQHQSEPRPWIDRSKELAYAANVLYERASAATDELIRDRPPNGEPWTHRLLSEMGMNSVAFMLAGFAVENLLKALRVAQLNLESPIMDDHPRFNALTSTHDLVTLAREAGTELDNDAVETLMTLKEFILWLGRYPRPKFASHFMPADTAVPGALKLPMTSRNTWATFQRLLASTYEQIDRACKQESA